MGVLKTVRLSEIKPNPHRQLRNYPIDQHKVEALRRSIKQVGFWEGVIVRPSPNGDSYECAFGHHRIHAAREELGPDAMISVIVRSLDDAAMLQMMGRENAEDQRGNFLIMLETWEAALSYLTNHQECVPSTVEVAEFLGWTYELSKNADRAGRVVLTWTGKACSAAHELIASGVLDRAVFNGLSVAQAREVAQTLNAQFQLADRTAKIEDSEESRKTAARTKVALVEAAKSVAHSVARNERPGGVQGLREDIIDRVYRHNQIPNLQQALNRMCRQVQQWNGALFGDKLGHVLAVVNDTTYEEEQNAYLFLRKDLEDAIDRCRKSIEQIDLALRERGPGASLKLVAGGQ